MLSDSLRSHIPAVIFSAYGIRNNRDAVHSSLEVESNCSDCNYTSAACDWILVELIVELGSQNREEIAQVLQSIFSSRLPLVYKNSDDTTLVLPSGIPAWLSALIQLYAEGRPLSLAELSLGTRQSRGNIRTQFRYKADLVCQLQDGRYEILPEGRKQVELYVSDHNEVLSS